MTWVTTEAKRWHDEVLQFASHYASIRADPPIRAECERRVLRWVLFCVSLARPPDRVDAELLQIFLGHAYKYQREASEADAHFGRDLRSKYERVIKEWSAWYSSSR